VYFPEMPEFIDPRLRALVSGILLRELLLRRQFREMSR
jgi:hypothetical protein